MDNLLKSVYDLPDISFIENDSLNNEVGRYEIEKVETPVDTTNRYTVTIPESDLNGVNINEMALVDAEPLLIWEPFIPLTHTGSPSISCSSSRARGGLGGKAAAF
ncbi:hypothetical protein [Acutalibacter muris]|uniref:hypothetical protein n=1 Tax=Acutalibacter muris TaxID=1796620 RepID=UPI001C3EDF42|nr:hypothetical protein [Acutalibacter muris]